MRGLTKILNWRLTLGVAMLLFSASGIRAQQKLDCSKIFSRGCTSFNELVDAQDGDILRAINFKGKAARVCFVDAEDNFVIISFPIPPADKFGWHKAKSSLLYSSSAETATLKRYKDGVENDNFYMQWVWHRFGEDDDPTAEGKGILGRTSQLYVDSNETTFSASWLNKANTLTKFQLSIRLATGRYKESYSFNDTKGKLNSIDNTGHCVRYEEGVHN